MMGWYVILRIEDGKNERREACNEELRNNNEDVLDALRLRENFSALFVQRKVTDQNYTSPRAQTTSTQHIFRSPILIFTSIHQIFTAILYTTGI